MVGIWSFLVWKENQRPIEFIELGPGRGSLMSDILRTWKNLEGYGAFNSIQKVHLVEISPLMSKLQLNRLEPFQKPLLFYENIADVKLDESNCNIFIANEFFDALPIHRFKVTPYFYAEHIGRMEGDSHRRCYKGRSRV